MVGLVAPRRRLGHTQDGAERGAAKGSVQDEYSIIASCGIVGARPHEEHLLRVAPRETARLAPLCTRTARPAHAPTALLLLVGVSTRLEWAQRKPVQGAIKSKRQEPTKRSADWVH